MPSTRVEIHARRDLCGKEVDVAEFTGVAHDLILRRPHVRHPSLLRLPVRQHKYAVALRVGDPEPAVALLPRHPEPVKVPGRVVERARASQLVGDVLDTGSPFTSEQLQRERLVVAGESRPSLVARALN
jgi:hypothetical protein